MNSTGGVIINTPIRSDHRPITTDNRTSAILRSTEGTTPLDRRTAISLLETGMKYYTSLNLQPLISCSHLFFNSTFSNLQRNLQSIFREIISRKNKLCMYNKIAALKQRKLKFKK